MFSFQIQPNETVIGVGIDFSDRLAAGETVSSYTVNDSGKGVIVSDWSDGAKVFMTVKGNSLDGQNVKVTITATGSQGSVREGEITLVIREK